jgi:flavin-dependent dehydrogenase
MRRQNRFLDRWLEGATPIYDKWLSIAQVPFMTKTPVEGDILLAGDAAGMVAPLAGDGMAMALQSGMMAAEHVEQGLGNFTASSTMTRDYANAWNRAFSGRLRLGRALQSIMLRPALINPGLRLMNLLPAIGDVLVAQTRDLKLAGKS